jgi:hypothetical protein
MLYEAREEQGFPRGHNVHELTNQIAEVADPTVVDENVVPGAGGTIDIHGQVCNRNLMRKS